jgi:prohibitin 2
MTRTIRPAGQLRVPAVAMIVVLVLLFGLMAVGQAYTPVEPGTVVLIKRFGGLTGDVYTEGLHWRMPFVDRMVVIPTAIRTYETSDEPTGSTADYRDIPVTAQTIDGQQTTIKYTVVFFIPPEKAVSILRTVGGMDAIVSNVVKTNSRNLVRMWAQKYTAEDLYSGEGIFEYEYAVRDALVRAFEGYGVTLDRFLVRKIDFDDDYIKAIEQQQIAQEAIETAQYTSEAAEYEKERQIRLAEAEAKRTTLQAAADAERTKLQAAADAERQRLLADSEAYSIKARAEADAERQRLLAEAEAYSIEKRGEALKQFPDLVQWEFVRNLQNVQWGILPGEGVTPLMPLPAFEEQPEEGVTITPESPSP